MNKFYLEEHAPHGTIEFPVGIHSGELGGGAGHIFPMHWHKEFEFLTVTKGTMHVHLEENSVTLSEGQGIFINSNCIHSLEAIGKSSFLAVVFSPEIAVFSENDRVQYINPLIHGQLVFEAVFDSHTEWQRRIVECIHDINRIHKSNAFAARLSIRSYIFEMLALCINHSKKISMPVINKKTVIIRQISEYIDKNYNEDISLDTLSALVHLSKEYLCRVFKEQLNLSPITFLNQHRILKSTEFLMTTDSKISQIAVLCGFNHIGYFNRVFKKMMGIAPAQYRKRNMKLDFH